MSSKLQWHLFSFVFAIFLAAESLLLFAMDESFDSVMLVLSYIALISLVCLVASFVISYPLNRLWPVIISMFLVFSTLELKLVYF